MILDRQGVSGSAIARQLGIDRKTARKSIAPGLTASSYKSRPPHERLIALSPTCGSALWPIPP